MHFPRAGMEVAEIAKQFQMSEETAKEFKGMNMVIGLMNVMLIGACLTIAGYLKAEKQ